MRKDIQFLRGVAVLLVVIFHSNIEIFDRGYLGVDIFFVISGFLITKIILNGLYQGDFSFSEFYLRRAKRLLPALYSTLMVTALISLYMLTPKQFGDFVEQMFGAVTFTSNLILPTQISYFADEAESKPLLHIWSLSLEEQYYFTLPLLLFLASRRVHFIGLILVFMCSVIWCMSWSSSSGAPPFLWRFGDASINEWAFFLFPTRAWELLAGSIAAWVCINRGSLEIGAVLKWIVFTIILITTSFGFDDVHPRLDSMIVVMGTTMLLLGKDNWLPNHPVISAIKKTGDWSYSIYLVHWPLFAFAYVGYVEDVPWHISALLIPISIALGGMQYRCIEAPFHFNWSESKAVVWRKVGFATVALIAVPIGVYAHSNRIDLENDPIDEIRKINHGLSSECEGSVQNRVVNKECKTSEQPKLAVWGDSYAMHLVPGLVTSNPEVIQLTKSVCGPIDGLAPILGRYNESWAEACLQHNEQSMRIIQETDSVTHVVLSSPFGQYFGDYEGKFLIQEAVVNKSPSLASEYLIQTIELIKSYGKTAILISPPPKSGFNVGACLEREDRRLPIFRKSCEIEYETYIASQQLIIESLKEVVNQTGVRVIWLEDLLCEKSFCETRRNGTYLYRDGGHLSISGSRELLGSINLQEEYRAERK